MDFRLDDIDRKLLALLQADARESTAKLARKLNLARTTVVARIARLEKEGVIVSVIEERCKPLCPWQLLCKPTLKGKRACSFSTFKISVKNSVSS